MSEAPHHVVPHHGEEHQDWRRAGTEFYHDVIDAGYALAEVGDRDVPDSVPQEHRQEFLEGMRDAQSQAGGPSISEDHGGAPEGEHGGGEGGEDPHDPTEEDRNEEYRHQEEILREAGEVPGIEAAP